MKKFGLSILTAAVLFAGVPTKANAMVCLAPTPFCAVVLIGGVVLAAIDMNQPQELQKFTSVKDAEDIVAVVKAVEAAEDGDLVIRLSNAQYRPGFTDIVERYKSGMIEGNMSLKSLYAYRPDLFADLDKVGDIINHTVKNSAMNRDSAVTASGEINWAHYAQLAADADAIYQNTFIVK